MHQLLVFLAACAGGAVDSVAGGGTLSGARGFRREMRQADPRVYALVVPSLIGGLTGAILLKRTAPGVFERLIPALIRFAAVGAGTARRVGQAAVRHVVVAGGPAMAIAMCLRL